jgi:hypothetical protein
MSALGRQEDWEDSPEDYPQTRPYEWWHWHDDYGDAQPAPEWVAKLAASGALDPAPAKA